jgi:HK97 family phage portal protein
MADEAFERFRRQVQEEYAGLRNARKILVLEGGASWDSVSFSPEDAEMLASRRFGVEELARLFGVPPPMVGDLSHGTFTNSREAARWFATFTLTPWARKIEAAMGAALFGSGETGMSIEVDLSGLLRGDAEARWQSHKIAVEAGILEPDEIREVEGWGPRKAKPAAEGGGNA